jgi:hypothetical protein
MNFRFPTYGGKIFNDFMIAKAKIFNVTARSTF